MEQRLPRPPSQWDEYVERARQQLPAGPPSLLNGYVRFAPWVAIVVGVIGFLFGVLGSLLLAIVAPLMLVFGGAEGVSAGAGAFVALVVVLVLTVLEIAGGYLMLKRSATGWWILGLGLVVSALNDLFSVSILGLIIVLLIAWIHIQVRPR